MKKTRNESPGHQAEKDRIEALCRDPRAAVYVEYRNADLVVVDIPTVTTVAIEVESTPRNVLRNIRRNLKNGCHGVLVVSRDERFFEQISRTIARHLTSTERTKVRLVKSGDIYALTIQDFIQTIISNPKRKKKNEHHKSERH
ncbi:hypothetical protein G0Q06_12865 [Puniceicoccales bacterium CK1056]|uniref:Uncharacterized protein n=1 Tax=Oceanipulchritudo coccoides TaxID=2706888 RepID=A0A6B2M594_9BACT|nr:hypothetical protein [Oceanipulchritudo coccoides]NDV63349.1 hypothetical protein [Oceanipulchritudo coccoides]